MISVHVFFSVLCLVLGHAIYAEDSDRPFLPTFMILTGALNAAIVLNKVFGHFGIT